MQEANRRLAEQLRDLIKAGLTDECSICLSDLALPVITPCAHVFCRGCITQYIDTARPPPAQCPLCRGAVYSERLLEAAPPVPDEDEEEAVEAAAAPDPFDDIEVSVSSSKVNAVLKEMAMIKREDAKTKIVVVSQFTSLLSILQVTKTSLCFVNWNQ